MVKLVHNEYTKKNYTDQRIAVTITTISYMKKKKIKKPRAGEKMQHKIRVTVSGFDVETPYHLSQTILVVS